jgi:hypothetical protein
MSALHELIDVFDPLTENGKMTKSALTSSLNAIMKAAGHLVHDFTLGFLKMRNAMLRLAIDIVPTIGWIKKMWEQHKGLDKLKMLFTGLVIIVALLGITTLIAFLPLILLVGVLVAAILGLALAFGWLESKMDTITGVLARVFSKDAWKNAAADAIQGLIDGLTKGIKGVQDASATLGKAAKDGVKLALGISSPSKEFMKLGMFSGQGFAQGFEMADSGLHIASPGVASAGGGGGATTILLGGVQIDINGATGPSGDWKQQLETQLADIFESAMLERGK